MTVARALIRVGPEIMRLLRSGDDDGAKRRAREEAETALDVALAKERLRARRGR